MPDATVELERAAADIPLTRAAREILDQAAAMAKSRGDSATPTDVLRATLAQRGTLADEAIRAVGVDPVTIASQLPAANGAGPPSIPIRQLLVNANREAQVLGHYQVDSIHLLLAMLYSDSPETSTPLQKAGLTLYDIRRHLQTSPMPATANADQSLRRKPLPSLRGVLKVSPVFLGIVAATAASGAILWTGVFPAFLGAFTIVFVTAGWITSVCIHEFAHALVAYVGGDRGVKDSGYLDLNPLRYTNVLLSLVMPVLFLLLGGIGLPGGAVYINRNALRSRTWDSAVSVAGPVGTMVCGLLVAIPFMVPNHDAWITNANVGFFAALAFLGFIEAFALVLNLVPVPGLDGFGILRPWLPYSVQGLAVQYGQLGILAVFAALWFVAPIRDAFFQLVVQITSLGGIDPLLIAFGQAHMRFQ